MLYERWRRIARDKRDEIALRDFAQGSRWTFGELAQVAESGSVAAGEIAFPSGTGPEFVLRVLRAWRAGKVTCPLESGQAPPTPGKLPGACVHLKITSATTGVPRVIAFTAEQLAADAENIVMTMGLRPDWPNLGIISLSHSYGFSNLITPLLLHGIPLILADAPLPETVRRAASLVEAVTLAAVPAMWRVWHEAGAISPNVRLAISAGAPLPVALEQAVFEKSRLKIHNFYGASECGGIAYDSTETPRSDTACAGSPMCGVKLSVADDGCLEVRSQAAGQTYLPSSEPNLADGCFHTSDLAEITGGLVYLRGRATDQINIAGRKVSPETIELALLKHARVRGCVVFGIPSVDAERTEEIVAAVAGQVTEPELRQFAQKTLPAWQVPRRWWFVESLQTNARGKVSRAEWRARFLSQ